MDHGRNSTVAHNGSASNVCVLLVIQICVCYQPATPVCYMCVLSVSNYKSATLTTHIFAATLVTHIFAATHLTHICSDFCHTLICSNSYNIHKFAATHITYTNLQQLVLTHTFVSPTVQHTHIRSCRCGPP